MPDTRALRLLVLLLLAPLAAPQDPSRAGRPEPPAVVQRDRQTAAEVDAVVRELRIPLRAGKLSTSDLAAAILEILGIPVEAADLPARSLDVRGLRGRLALLASRKLLLDCVGLRVDEDELVVTIDRVRTRTLRRELRRRIASWCGTGVLEREYALELPAHLDPARRLVVLVHGVDSGPEIWHDLRVFLAARPSPPQVAVFRYPNDEACETIAAELAARLATLGEQPVALVGHSMGGLVARAVVDDPDLDPGNVDVLVTIGTPHRGSSLAPLRFVLEAAQAVEEFAAGHSVPAAFRAGLRDGLGEAGGDLMRGSVFLTRLERHGRNPDVRYHVVLGTRGIPGGGLLRAVGRSAAASRLGVDDLLAGVDELVAGRGDGAVSVERGRLAGIEPVLVPLDHLGLVRWDGLFGRSSRGRAHPVFERIVGWVGAE